MATIEQLYQMKIDEVNKWMSKANALHLENLALREIVRAVAEDDPYCYNDNNGKMECLFCYDTWGWASNEKHTKDHEPDCLITKARALIQQAVPLVEPKE